MCGKILHFSGSRMIRIPLEESRHSCQIHEHPTRLPFSRSPPSEQREKRRITQVPTSNPNPHSGSDVNPARQIIYPKNHSGNLDMKPFSRALPIRLRPRRWTCKNAQKGPPPLAAQHTMAVRHQAPESRFRMSRHHVQSAYLHICAPGGRDLNHHDRSA